MELSIEWRNLAPPAAPKGTWRSGDFPVSPPPLGCIQKMLKPALRAAESGFPPTSKDQPINTSTFPGFNTSKAPKTEVSERDFSRSDSKEATSPETKGAEA